jgi:hypothetical protein
MLTAGNVTDVKAAPALLKQAGRMRYPPRALGVAPALMM